MSRAASPRRIRGNDRLDGRRMEVFRLTAPVFRAMGYRGATIKALAHAAHLSPAALYHYFPSKADLATYPLRRDNRPEAHDHAGPMPTAAEPPLELVSRLVDVFIGEMPFYLLAIDLAREAGVSFDRDARTRLFKEGERALLPSFLAAAPALDRQRALELADAVLALVVAPSLTGLPGTADSVREGVVRLLRDRLLAEGVGPDAFERAMRVREIALAPDGALGLARAG